MATTAQCVFCFEVLTGELEKRKRFSLPQCEELWEKYQAHINPTKGEPTATTSDDEQADDEELDGGDATRLTRTLRPDGVSRLQAESPASGSGKSTPSTDSGSSTSTLFSANSKASSKSSFFSFARRSPVRVEPEYPVFVTWNEINSRGNKSLRGCVGTFEAAPLAQNLETYSITSYVVPESRSISTDKLSER